MTTNSFLEQPRRGKTREAKLTPHKAEPQCGGRAPRNQTLTVTAGEIPALEPLVSTPDDLRSGFRDNMLVNGDLLECLDLIPDRHFDLILLDPPYNLDKDFNGRKFSSMKSERLGCIAARQGVLEFKVVEVLADADVLLDEQGRDVLVVEMLRVAQ